MSENAIIVKTANTDYVFPLLNNPVIRFGQEVIDITHAGGHDEFHIPDIKCIAHTITDNASTEMVEDSGKNRVTYSHGLLTISSDGCVDTRVTITDINGRIIAESISNGTEPVAIDMTCHTPGIYIVGINNEVSFKIQVK